MHAAADGERRLAAAAAVARQQLDLGLEYALAGASCEQQLQPAAQEQLQQMVKMTQEVVEQNQLLQKAMKQQQAQLAQQQVRHFVLRLLVSVPLPALGGRARACNHCICPLKGPACHGSKCAS
jgi:hypothetical protein